jgi:hypothetical protein
MKFTSLLKTVRGVNEVDGKFNEHEYSPQEITG